MLPDDKPLVSVLMCLKNASATLRTTFQSVSCQTYPKIEVIVVDGLSHDNTINIAREFQHQPITIVSESDTGYYHALNKAILLARGEYLLALNGDDILEPHAIEMLLDTIRETGVDIAAGHSLTVDANGNMIGHLASIWNGAAPIRCLLRHGAMLVSQNTYRRVGLYDEKKQIIADRTWMHRALQLGASVAIVDRPLLRFRTSGMSSVNSDLHLQEIDMNLTSLEQSLTHGDRCALRHPWMVGTQEVIRICRAYPVSGKLRQALLADRLPRVQASKWPAVSVALLEDQDAKTLQTRLADIQKQALSNLEILVYCKDTPESLALKQSVAQKDLRIHCFDAPPKTRLLDSLLQATGDYFILGSSSFSNPDYLTELHAVARRENALLVAADSKGPRTLVHCNDDTIMFDPQCLTDFLFEQLTGLTVPTLFVARDIYKKVIDYIQEELHDNSSDAWAFGLYFMCAFAFISTRVGKVSREALTLRSDCLRITITTLFKGKARTPATGHLQPDTLTSHANAILTNSLVSNPRITRQTRSALINTWESLLQALR
jgi:hypothetical protein